MIDNLHDSPEQLIDDYLQSLPSGSTLWIAYSGGLDSHVLLHACHRARVGSAVTIKAIHIDHQLHADSARWALHCQQCCHHLQIPLQIEQVQVVGDKALGIEAAARQARYHRWCQRLQPGDQLLTAHHQDDQAETVLLALLRGSGVDGLAAMPRQRPLGQGVLVRPLLTVPKAKLLDYATRWRLQWLDDPSNQQLHYDRNFLRHHIIPQLKIRWPALATTFTRTAQHCSTAAHQIAAQTAAQLTTMTGQRPGTLSIKALQAVPPAQRHTIIRYWIQRAGFPVPTTNQLVQIDHDLIAARQDANPCFTWSGSVLRRYRDDLYVMAPLPERPTMTLPWTGRQPLALPVPLGYITCYDSMMDTTAFNVRFAVSGSRCRAHRGAPSRSLKYLFQQAAIPPWVRPYVPLIFNSTQLVAIAGLQSCHDAFAPIGWSGHPWQTLNLFPWL
jgi:tRNA(Ile)-lysidine synthase